MQKAHKRMSRMMAARTPMTIPAIAPPLRPLLLTEGAAAAADEEAPADVGVWKGTVVVADPVVVIVVATLLVGRMNAVFVAVVATGTM